MARSQRGRFRQDRRTRNGLLLTNHAPDQALRSRLIDQMTVKRRLSCLAKQPSVWGMFGTGTVEIDSYLPPTFRIGPQRATPQLLWIIARGSKEELQKITSCTM